MKVRALPKFEGIKDLERDVFPKAGDEWECTAERADLLLSHGVVEIVEEKKEEVKVLSEPEEPKKETQTKPKEEKTSQRTKKTSKK